MGALLDPNTLVLMAVVVVAEVIMNGRIINLCLFSVSWTNKANKQASRKVKKASTLAQQTYHNRIATGQKGKEGETKQTQP